LPGADPNGGARLSEVIVAPLEEKLTRDDRLRLLRLMVMTRLVQLRSLDLRRSRRRELSPTVIRREAIGVGAGYALVEGDRLCAPGRYLGAHLAMGLSPGSYLSACFESGTTGRPDTLEPSEAAGALSTGVDLWVLAAGMAIRSQEAEPGAVVMTIAEESATAAPGWDEMIEMAQARRLPLVIVLERTGADSQTANGHDASPELLAPEDSPLRTDIVNGGDVEAVARAARRAVEHARSGSGATLVSCVPGAGPPDPRTDETGADPAELFARRLIASGYPRTEIDAIVASALREVVTWTL
jgi:TPP-dependent pyruvate/acetoin dehydrogenase alpha subunit